MLFDILIIFHCLLLLYLVMILFSFIVNGLLSFMLYLLCSVPSLLPCRLFRNLHRMLAVVSLRLVFCSITGGCSVSPVGCLVGEGEPRLFGCCWCFGVGQCIHFDCLQPDSPHFDWYRIDYCRWGHSFYLVFGIFVLSPVSAHNIFDLFGIHLL